MYIGIVGCMGIGKTRLTEALSLHLGYRPFFEPTKENPYLDDFYADMKAYAFRSQMFVIIERFRQHQIIKEMLTKNVGVIQDQLIHVDTLYARLAHELGTMDDRDFATYQRHVETIMPSVQLPDVIVHLTSPIPDILARIDERDRKSERGIDPQYLVRLSQLIAWWVDSIRTTTQVIELDWTTYKEVDDVVAKIEKSLNVQLQLPVQTVE